jgi:hypothetical protein
MTGEELGFARANFDEWYRFYSSGLLVMTH